MTLTAAAVRNLGMASVSVKSSQTFPRKMERPKNDQMLVIIYVRTYVLMYVCRGQTRAESKARLIYVNAKIAIKLNISSEQLFPSI